MNGKIPDDVILTIYGFKTLGKEHFAEEFFQMLQDTNPAYLPSKIGMYEPIKTPFSLVEAKKMWVQSERDKGFYGGIMIKGNKYFGNISWNLNEDSNIIGFRIARDIVVKKDGTEKFIYMAKKMFLWANGVWGYACHSSYQNSRFMYTPGITFRTCIGGIPWIALFGPPYVEMFGRGVIESVPCRVEEFAENRFMLLTSDEPMEMNRELLDIQTKVKKHLGEDAFCRHDHPTRLTMEDLKAGKGKTNTEGYRSPDISAYIKDTGKEDEGLIVQINDNGTMTTYKIKPD